MKCPKCKFYSICGGRLNETVENCVRFKSVEQTNEEWLRQATTEQLAEVLWEQINGAFNSGYACCNLKQDKDYVGRYKRFMEWLKQPHTNEE